MRSRAAPSSERTPSTPSIAEHASWSSFWRMLARRNQSRGQRRVSNGRRPNMWGIIPAAGLGTRIQPLAFSKELLPVGGRLADGTERPKAVSEYVVERMLRAGADKLCFVISPGKSDIV